jgi:hypothetical protein
MIFFDCRTIRSWRRPSILAIETGTIHMETLHVCHMSCGQRERRKGTDSDTVEGDTALHSGKRQASHSECKLRRACPEGSLRVECVFGQLDAPNCKHDVPILKQRLLPINSLFAFVLLQLTNHSAFYSFLQEHVIQLGLDQATV